MTASTTRSISLVATTAWLIVIGACRVDPAADYDRTTELISQRTAATRPYQPSDQDVVADRVESLLADGLGVREAVEIALLNNPGFQALFEEVGISRADVVQSGLLANPILTAVLKAPEGGGRISIDFGLSQEVAQLLQIPIRRKIAQAKLEQTIAAVAQRAVDLAAEVKAGYYRLRTRQMEEQTIAESVRSVDESTQIVELQVRNGAASQLDLNLARAALMDVHLELLAVRRQRESAEIELGRTLGLAPRAYPRILLDPLPAVEALASVDVLVERAEAERLDLLRAQQVVLAAEDEVVRQSLLVFPSVMIGLAAERPERRAMPARNLLADTARSSIRSGTLTAPDIQSRGQRDLERRQFIDFLIGPAFQVTVPLFDQNQAQIATAAFRVRQRRREYQELLTRVRSEIEQSLSAFRTAREQFEFYRREAIPIAEANVAGSRTVFTAGAQSILVLLEAQRSLIARRRACVVTQGDCAAACVELERVVGGRLPHAPATQPEQAHE